MEPIPGPRLPSYPSPVRRRRRRWIIRGVVLLATVLLAGLFGSSALRGIALLFRVNNPAPADAIVLLLGGYANRPDLAAELYHQGLAPRILMGQAIPIGNSLPDESRICKQILLDHGVPASAITILPPPVVTSTFMEAQAVRRYAETHPMRRIIVVTTSFHTRRGRWVFRKVLSGTGIDVRVAAQPHLLFDESNWYRSDEGLVSYVDEAIKTLYYWIAY